MSHTAACGLCRDDRISSRRADLVRNEKSRGCAERQACFRQRIDIDKPNGQLHEPHLHKHAA